ncbi:hypothetical protein BDW62DRAFT_46914 [Aspergillus aurantiobrunneus]
MYASAIGLGSLLAGQALAAHQALLPYGTGLSKRQGGDSFIPDITPGCPDGWPTCGTSGTCYSPSRGDTCCPGGTYACPVGSFCLQDPYCCPDGLDPATCAEEFGITLDPTTTAEPTTTSSSSTTSVPVIPTTTSSSSTGTPTPSSSTPVPPQFTGGANAQVAGAAAAVLGGLGMVGNLLI